MSEKTNKIFMVQGSAFRYLPTTITPSIEVIKNSERTLNGTLCCDIIAEKQSLEVTWDVLDGESFKAVQDTFSKLDRSIKVAYAMNEDESLTSENQTAKDYYCDGFSYLPCYIGEKLFWQEVTVKLVQA